MFISHFFDVGIEWRVLSSLYAPQKEQLAKHRWSLVGEGVQVVCGYLCQEAHGRESGSLSLTLGFNLFRLCCCILDPPSSGKTQIIGHLVLPVPIICPSYSSGSIAFSSWDVPCFSLS